MTEVLTLTSKEIVSLIFIGYCMGIATIGLAGFVSSLMNR